MKTCLDTQILELFIFQNSLVTITKYIEKINLDLLVSLSLSFNFIDVQFIYSKIHPLLFTDL